MRGTSLWLAAGLAVAMGGLAFAQTPAAEGERPGRFIMQPVEGGILRMDTESGAMSLCTRQAGSLACAPVADERGTPREIERLGRENQELRAELKRLEELLGHGGDRGFGDKGPGDKGMGGDRQARRSPKFELPSEEDVDKALGYLDRMLKKFRERMRDFDGGGRGTPL